MKMMEIIAVSGPNNSGKSTMVRLLVLSLIDCGKITAAKYLKVHQKGLVSPDLADVKKQMLLLEDFIGVFECSGRVLGITSFGDSVSLLNKALAVFKSYSCDQCVLACRTKESKTYKEMIAQPHLMAILFKERTILSTQRAAANSRIVKAIAFLLS